MLKMLHVKVGNYGGYGRSHGTSPGSAYIGEQFGWTHFRIFSSKSKLEITFYSTINSTQWKGLLSSFLVNGQTS